MSPTILPPAWLMDHFISPLSNRLVAFLPHDLVAYS